MTLLQTPSFTLHGKRALVTGGSRGIGFAAAVALAQAGAEVWIAARGREALAHATGLAAEHSLAFHPLELDITDTQEVARVLATLPTPDILVNSAGLARHQPFLEVNEENFDAVMALNLRATFFTSQHVARRMRAGGKGGSIIHISSQMGHVGGPERSVYCASKFALEGLTRTSLADPAFRRYVLDNIKLRRPGRLEDIMGPVVFLASEAAGLITGSALMVDGGWTAT
ncbi:MAG: SDR family oxidoreductase [Enterobacter hormaechei]|nr:SDR family oxidoreductase [Enterobacter hormaechei]